MFKMENRNYDLRVNASYEVPEFRPSDGVLRPSRLKALLVYLIVAVGLLASSTIGSVLTMAFPDIGFWPMQTIITLIYYVLACLLPVFLFASKDKNGRARVTSMRFNRMRFRTVVLAVVLGIIGLLFANNLSVLWALPFDAAGLNIYAAEVPVPESIGQLLFAIFSVGIMPGVCEELVFRGFMQPAFEERGTKRAVVLVSLLFALLHGSTLGFPVQFALGVIMAVLLVVTDSIYPGIIFHAVYNSAAMVLMYVQNQMGMVASVPGQLFNDIQGLFGVFSAVWGVMMLGAPIFLILFSLYRRAKNSGFNAIKKQPMRLRGGEIALLCGGLSLSLLYYVMDFLMMAGVLM